MTLKTSPLIPSRSASFKTETPVPGNGKDISLGSRTNGLPFDLSRCVIFFDFDNTITQNDVLDKIIEQFAIDDRWVLLEEEWRKGKIGSKECLEGQLKSVRVTRSTLSRYLSTVSLDSSFKQLLQFVRRNKIEFMVVSDSFSFAIHQILKHHKIRHIPVYANELRFQKDHLIPTFPFFNEDCLRCAHCKKIHLKNNSHKTTIYVGDGRSDICAAECADIVFAKDSLLDYLQKVNKPCIEFKNLGSVLRFLEQLKGKQIKRQTVKVSMPASQS